MTLDSVLVPLVVRRLPSMSCSALSVPPFSRFPVPDAIRRPPLTVPPLSVIEPTSSWLPMVSVPAVIDSRPLITESPRNVSVLPVIVMFSFERSELTVKLLAGEVFRMVTVRSPAWSITTSVLAVGIRPPAQFAATSQKPEVCEIQVLAMVPVAKLMAFEKVVGVTARPPVFTLAKAPLRQASAPQDSTV